MTIEELEAEISAVPRFGSGAGLDNLKLYLEKMGHPERKLRVIHVAGTNGKGSVCAYLESILREAGYKTALFTSPHLLCINERFRINFQMCGDALLVDAWKKVRCLMEEPKEGRKPLTYFEILFLMGLLIFEKEKPDYCIMETGLGGRLDATVLTAPVLSVITSISLDHTEILGDTIEKIAAEKAGIIKPGVPVVALDEKNGAFTVIRQKAVRQRSPLYKVESESITISKKTENTIDFSIRNRYYRGDSLRIRGHAEYQAENGGLAAVAARVLLPDLTGDVLQRGLLGMFWEGRMEEVLPGVYVDGAHNPGAVRQVCRMARKGNGRWNLLFAVCGDKDYSEMIHILASISWKRIFITGTGQQRGADVWKIAECFRKETDGFLRIYERPEQALSAALKEKKEEERLLCLGSLYLAGELKRCVTYRLESEDLS